MFFIVIISMLVNGRKVIYSLSHCTIFVLIVDRV